MGGQDEVSDPTDWLNTPVASLEPVEAGLRCEICKDFYTAPVLTACCHTFCSGCIRRSLSSVNASRKCPLCWAPFEEGQLRKNKVVEDLVKTFQAARGDILALGRAVRDGALNETNRGNKRKLSQVDGASQLSNGPSPRKTRSQTNQRTRAISDSVEPEEDVEQGEDGERQPDDGKVSCPICQLRMPEAQVFTHLDTHSDDKQAPTPAPSTLGIQTITPTMNPLPTLSYTLLNDVQLRKRLRELGIPADGNKQTMSRRHTEWRNLVNANCDSSKPKSKTELLKELNQWERTQNSVNHSYGMKINRTTVKEKDFDRDGWSKSHSTDFQNLIAAARAKVKTKTENTAVTPDSDEKEHSSGIPHSAVLDGRPENSTDAPSSSQADVVNLMSPEQIRRINGFGVP